jgi:predicted CoA-binding protein
MKPEEKVTLVIGASPNPDRTSYEAVISLRHRGIPVIALGRRESEIGDVRIQKGMPKPDEKVHTVTLYLSAANQVEFYDYILSLEPERIIFNPGTVNPELGDMATIQGIEVVERCMLVMLTGGEF